MCIQKTFIRQESRAIAQSQSKENSDVSTKVIGKESRMLLAYNKVQPLDEQLIERICERDNLNQAYKRVVNNGGRSGIDEMKVEQLKEWLKVNGETLQESLLTGKYKPQAVLSVAIKKPGGGERWLGIPTVVDRFVQQAISQVLIAIIDPHFDDSSYGYRPGKSAHQGLKAVQGYVKEGYKYVAELDIEKYFDTINHDMVMGRLAKYVKDKRVLKIIRKFLQAGMWRYGVYQESRIGTPQGGPLSPLLANLLLDDLDKELRKRGHRFCRYADDCNVYLRSKASAERVLTSLKSFLTSRLKLKVNEKKSQAAHVSKGVFLGYTISGGTILKASKESIKRLKQNIRQATRRKGGVAIQEVISRVNQKVIGWKAYFQLDKRKQIYQELDSWIKHRLRCYRLIQRKKGKSIVKWLMALGVKEEEACKIASSGKGWWRLSQTRALHESMNNQWFKDQGLISLAN